MMQKPQLVILTEEPSCAEFLLHFLPRLATEKFKISFFPHDHFVVIPHQGKSDLVNSIPKKLKGWARFSEFIVLHDQDSNDCVELKAKLLNLNAITRKEKYLVRIVCRELEAWYLGCHEEMSHFFSKNSNVRQQASKLRNPDVIVNPFLLMQKMFPKYQKLSGSQRLGKEVDVLNFCQNNKSKSFKVFIQAIENFMIRMKGSCEDPRIL